MHAVWQPEGDGRSEEKHEGGKAGVLLLQQLTDLLCITSQLQVRHAVTASNGRQYTL